LEDFEMKFARKIFFAVVVFVLALAMCVVVYANDVNVAIEGVAVDFGGQGPVIVDGRTLVPVRGVFEMLGFDVEWEQGTRTTVLTSAEFEIRITIDSAAFTTNGQSHTLDVPAQIIGGRTMVPIRMPLESVGLHLGWDGATSTVLISAEPMTAQAPSAGATMQQLNLGGGNFEVPSSFRLTRHQTIRRLEGGVSTQEQGPMLSDYEVTSLQFNVVFYEAGQERSSGLRATQAVTAIYYEMSGTSIYNENNRPGSLTVGVRFFDGDGNQLHQVVGISSGNVNPGESFSVSGQLGGTLGTIPQNAVRFELRDLDGNLIQ
jgi:hypothetical protein